MCVYIYIYILARSRKGLAVNVRCLQTARQAP